MLLLRIFPEESLLKWGSNFCVSCLRYILLDEFMYLSKCDPNPFDTFILHSWASLINNLTVTLFICHLVLCLNYSLSTNRILLFLLCKSIKCHSSPNLGKNLHLMERLLDCISKFCGSHFKVFEFEMESGTIIYFGICPSPNVKTKIQNKFEKLLLSLWEFTKHSKMTII